MEAVLIVLIICATSVALAWIGGGFKSDKEEGNDN